MALDPRALEKARAAMEADKQKAADRLDERRTRLYRRLPELKSIDEALQETMLTTVRLAISGAGDGEELEAVRAENLELQEERSELLRAAGFPEDYLDEHYLCEKCRDTGYVAGRMCICLAERYEAAQKAELSKGLNIGEETFDTFNLDWYDATPDPKTGISPRRNMDVVYETCVRYAEHFGKNAYNLFLSGGTGLGKTFLSACIARVVAEKGFSVVYETAGTIFSRFEADKFSRGEASDEAGADVRRYLTCDLLILDDLGTEMVTAFVTSSLYTLINTRLMTGRKTVINSNLTIDEIRSRYSPQIASRLEGSYQLLPFYGRDIRVLKARAQFE